MKTKQWKKEFRLLLKRSVVTGIPEIVATKSSYRRVLRFCIMIFCVAGFTYYTLVFLLIYWKYPTTMDVVIETPELVDLPAITFCSYNGITASKFCSRFPELCSPAKNYSEFCKANFYFYCNLNYILDSNETIPAISPFDLPNITREEFRELGNQPEDLLSSCRVKLATNYELCDPETKWVSVFDSMGLPNNCYTVNSLIGNVTASFRSVKSKSRIDLKIRTLTEDTFYTSTPTAIQMSVHNPRVILNPFKRGFAIKPCYNYYVYISKTINQLLPYPYNTNCTDYVSLWKARGGYGPLSKTQCREECLLNTSLAEMKCVDPLFVAYPNKANICHYPASSKRIFSQCNDGCLRACYKEDVTVDVEEHASLLAKNSMTSKKKCLSLIVLAFNRMEIKKFAYYPKYQTIELFGYIGGLLGVWLGISLLAIMDVLEAFYLMLKNLRRCLKKKASHRKAVIDDLFFDPYYERKSHRIVKIY